MMMDFYFFIVTFVPVSRPSTFNIKWTGKKTTTRAKAGQNNSQTTSCQPCGHSYDLRIFAFFKW